MKSSMELYLEERNWFHDQIVAYRNLLSDLDKTLLPVLVILEEEDVPIKNIFISLYARSIVLAPEMKLTQRVVDKIRAKLNIAKPLCTSFKDGFAEIFFYPPRISGREQGFDISNGEGTCDVVVEIKERLVPGRTEEVRTFVPVGDCLGIELG